MDSEDKKTFPIDRLLDDIQKGKIYETMRTPGWKDIVQLVDVIQKDWAEQILARDLKTDDRQGILDDLIEKRGMRKGLVMFFRYLQIWKKTQDRDLDKK